MMVLAMRYKQWLLATTAIMHPHWVFPLAASPRLLRRIDKEAADRKARQQ